MVRVLVAAAKDVPDEGDGEILGLVVLMPFARDPLRSHFFFPSARPKSATSKGE